MIKKIKKDIFLQKKERKRNGNGFISVVVILIVFSLLFSGLYFLSSSLSELRITNSHKIATQAYYLAEAGINEAIWKLKNDKTLLDGDAEWENDFITNPTCLNFTDIFTRNGNLLADSSYEVEIINSDCAKGKIVSTAKIDIDGGKSSQRIVSTGVFKALNPNPVVDSVIFTQGDIDFLASKMNVFGGSAFANNDINLTIASTLNIDEKALAPGDINKSWLSTLNASAKCASNLCEGVCVSCPPASIGMPMIDINSEDPGSYKKKAQVAGTYYTEDQFDDLMWNNQNLIINDEITYVEGDVELQGAQSITINNGVLATSGDVLIGDNFTWCRCVPGSGFGCGFGKKLSCRSSGDSEITISHSSPTASGILTKGDLEIKSHSGEINIEGLIYASQDFKLSGIPENFNITGGIIANEISSTSIWKDLNVTFDDNIIREGIGTPNYSPIITTDHWEETY